LLWFGLGDNSLIFVLVHSVLWALALNTYAGFLGVSNPAHGRAQLWPEGLRLCCILVPAALPSILSGLKIGWAFAWRTLIAAELVFGASSGKGGLGWYIFQNRNELYTDKVFAGLAVVILIGCWWKAGVQYPGAADRAALGDAALTAILARTPAGQRLRSATILPAAFGVPRLA
jgi:ABC-type nitrate/sulfonate/bicarbonate transport system permease component